MKLELDKLTHASSITSKQLEENLRQEREKSKELKDGLKYCLVIQGAQR